MSTSREFCCPVCPLRSPFCALLPRPHRLNFKFHDNHACSVSLNALHSMSTPSTEPESPPRTVLSRTPPPVYAEFFSVSENDYAPAQFPVQFFDHFFSDFCVFASPFPSFSIWLSRSTSFFKSLLFDGRHYFHSSQLSLDSSSSPVPNVCPWNPMCDRWNAACSSPAPNWPSEEKSVTHFPKHLWLDWSA